MKLTQEQIEETVKWLTSDMNACTEHNCTVCRSVNVCGLALGAYQRVEALLVNLDTDIAAMRECDRKRTMLALADRLRRALYGEG